MAIINITTSEEQNQWDNIFCSVNLTKGIRSQLVSLSAANIFLSTTAFLENILILVALHKTRSLHPPSKLLYRNLAITDLCVGIIAQPLMAGYMIAAVNEEWAICRNVLVAGFTASCIVGSASLLTITSISLDRLLALLLRQKYRQVVTLRRIYALVAGLWVVSIVATALQFWKHHLTLWYGCIVIQLCLFLSTVSYAKIFITLRSKTIHNDMQYRKAVSSALCVYLAIVICFVPSAVVWALSTKTERSSSLAVAELTTTTFAFFNSSLNPALYCWKIVELRKAVKDTIGKLCSRIIGCFV